MSRLIIPLPMALATAVPKTNSAMKLKNAAHITAATGLSTRVPTTVAMEFAESWKPLMKSKMNAVSDDDEDVGDHGQLFLMEMLSSTFATSSHWSSASSSLSYRSFQRITSSGLGVPSNSSPMAAW